MDMAFQFYFIQVPCEWKVDEYNEQNWVRRFFIGNICWTRSLRNKGCDDGLGIIKRTKTGMSMRLETRAKKRDHDSSAVDRAHLVNSWMEVGTSILVWRNI